MRMLTCFKTLPPESIAGGIGQGGGHYWQNAVGMDLQREIAAVLDCPLELSPRPHGQDSFDRQPYDIPPTDFALTYMQLFEIPRRRPDAAELHDLISVSTEPAEGAGWPTAARTLAEPRGTVRQMGL